MEINNTSLPTTIGDGSRTIIYDNIKKISDLHRAGFSDNEFRNRALKYTLVTATEKGYDILDSKIFNSLESEQQEKWVYDTVAPFGDLFEKRANKKKFIKNIRKINPELCERLKDMADSYIRTMIGMIGEYESYVKENSQERSSEGLKLHYANLRESYKKSLNGEKEGLLRLAHTKGKDDWSHRFLIKYLEYILSDGLLIGRHSLCQIPLEDKPNSEVSGLQGIISFDEDNSLNKERKIRYNNLGFNLGNIIRLKGKDRENLTTQFDEESVEEVQEIVKKHKCRDCVIDLDDKNHQLSIVLFGKAIPIVGNGDKDERFIQALVSKAIKIPQYYLALELPSSSL